MKRLAALVGLLIAGIFQPAFAETAVHAQVIAATRYPHNFDCIDRSGANEYVDCTGTWTTPSTLLRTDVIHFHIRAAGAGGCPYQGGGGAGGILDFDLTDLPPAVVFTFQLPGAGHGCGNSMSGATAGGHVWIKYNDPDNPAHPLFTYSANGGRTDNAAGGGRGGQGCDTDSGGCSENDDPHVILQSFLPQGGGDGGPANLFPAGSSGPIGSGNAIGSGGQSTALGAGPFGAGGGGVGPGGLSCTLPCNRGGQTTMWGFDGYTGLVTIQIKPGI